MTPVSVELSVDVATTCETNAALSFGCLWRDRLDADELPLTHEFLSLMLGVRRPGVTVALRLLEKRGTIQAHRGITTIVDRLALKEISNGAYGTPEAEFQRLFG